MNYTFTIYTIIFDIFLANGIPLYTPLCAVYILRALNNKLHRIAVSMTNSARCRLNIFHYMRPKAGLLQQDQQPPVPPCEELSTSPLPFPANHANLPLPCQEPCEQAPPNPARSGRKQQ